MNIDKSDKEIENDFNLAIEEDQYKINLDADNDLDLDSIQYTIGNTKRDYHETSGLSLLKELEDKWEMIEKKKYLQTKAKPSGESYFDTNSKSYIKQNYKALIDEAKRKFLTKYRLSRKSNTNDEFDSFVKKKTNELEKYKYEPENNTQYQFTNQHQEYEQERYDNSNTNQYYQRGSKYSIRNNKQNTRKSFLKEDLMQNTKRKEIPLKYRGNLFNCNERTSIEGLVYETPNTIQEEEEEEKEDSNNQSNINKSYHKSPKEKLNVSADLVNKMRNVFEEISTPSTPNQITSLLSIQGNVELSCLTKQDNSSLNSLDRNFHDILEEINPSLNNRFSRKLKSIIQTEVDDDKYFSDLTKEAGYAKKRTKRDLEGMLSKVCDKKLSKKIEENVKLLNDVLVTEKIPKRNYYNSSCNTNHLVSAFINNNNNSNNINILDSNQNKICSRNQFDDCISKIYKTNALKINKLLKSSNSHNSNQLSHNNNKK